MDARETVAQHAVDEFQRRFSSLHTSIGVSPGRVNIIGEHTDYNGGFVLPAAVPYYTAVAFAPRTDDKIRVASPLFDDVYVASTSTSAALGGFGDFPLGMARSLRFQGGFDAAIASTIPMSAGMSSSAALLLATCKAIQALEPDNTPTDMDNARAARLAENDFVGVPCGLMDQFIVACAKEGTACLLDCLGETWVEVSVSLTGPRWAVVYSGIKRELSGGDYGAKVRESQGALAEVIETTGMSPGELRTLDVRSLEDSCGRAGVVGERALLLRHFVTENVRVHRMHGCLEAGDPEAAGEHLSQGHWSLSQDFGVSLPEIDRFVRRVERIDGIHGVRITGAGFGGSLLALVRDDEALARLRADASASLPPTNAVLDIPGFCGGATGWKR